MIDDIKRRQITKWVITIVTSCCLIYLGIRHIGSVAGAIVWLVNLTKPLLLGVIFALILNVPMSMVEQKILYKCRLQRAKRPIAIILSLLLVIGLFVSVAILVVPELFNAVKLIYQIITGGLEQLAKLEGKTEEIRTVKRYFSGVEIDWQGLKLQLEEWTMRQRNSFLDRIVELAGTAVSSVVTFFIAIVFSIYILAQKEKLKKQTCRLLRVWLPQKAAEGIIHMTDVYGKTFKLFVAGQATEAIILGVLCVVGMLILRIPYAPMIGALIGVTALVPLVGAYVGTIIGVIIILTESPFKALVFVVFIVILQQVEGNAIYPKTVGAKIKLPSLWVLAAVVVGGNLAGPVGLFLGVPLTSAAYTLLREATDNRERKLLNKEIT